MPFQHSIFRLVIVFFAVVVNGVGANPSDTRHWAYQTLTNPSVPSSTSPDQINPIDAFIGARLKKAGLYPTPPADRPTLLRRISFDLIGLPPDPQELAAFSADTAPNAYERAVERLLASPRHGERWGRHWMDVAHFAETHGNDQDRVRTGAWPYRDYLVRAFNVGTSYSRFIQEQTAGDILFPSDPQATVALGFLAAGPWDESSLRDIREDTLDRQIARYLDRDDMLGTVMSVVNSTTVQCARCHDHKFDPISQQDYYALQAVFAGVDRAHRAYDEDPLIHLRRQELLLQRRRLQRSDTNLLSSPKTGREVAAWWSANQQTSIQWTTLIPTQSTSMAGTTLVPQKDGSLLATGALPERDTYNLSFPAPDFHVTALQLELLTDASLPKQGPGRQKENGNLHLSEVQVFLSDPTSSQRVRLDLVNPTADFNQEGWTISHAIDGNEKSAWGIDPQEGKPHRAYFELKTSLPTKQGSLFTVVLQQNHGGGHLIGRFRISCTDVRTPVRILPPEITGLISQPLGQVGSESWNQVARFVLKEQISKALSALPPPSQVYAAASEFEPDGSLQPSLRARPIHVLTRGEITRPGQEAAPGSLSCIPELQPRFQSSQGNEESARRADLARWLTHRDNPLTWRSIVNRVWLLHFGRGLVETPNDFGRMGGTPSHPELLDWLAVWFRDKAQGDLKQLHRLLTTSATYRQQTGPVQAVALSHDPENRLFSHMNRTRLDAECLHDAMMQASGRLDLRMGGSSDKQFDLKPGIHVTPRLDYSKFDIDSFGGQRRSVYRFLFRTLPDPFMDALDCPAGDQLLPSRNNSITVQQALSLWNSAFVTRQAEHLARRLSRENSAEEHQIQQAFEWVFSRAASPQECQEFLQHSRRHGLANTCRLLFNANEFIFVN